MNNSIKKSQEIAHFANDLSQKVSSIAYEIQAQNVPHQNILGDTIEIVKNLSAKLNETDQDELIRLTDYIISLTENGSANFTSVLDLFEWSTEKSGKYITEYEDFAKSLGLDKE